MRIIVAYIVAVMLSARAQAVDVDWKMYGFVPNQSAYCFYDANGITRTSNRVRVWTKCLLQKDLDGLDIKGELGGKIVENAARKLVSNYVPPYAMIEDINYDQATVIIQYEETANLSHIQPSARFFYELNCSERMIQILSTYVRVNGKEGFSEKPSGWQHVPPEGAGAALLKMLCR